MSEVLAEEDQLWFSVPGWPRAHCMEPMSLNPNFGYETIRTMCGCVVHVEDMRAACSRDRCVRCSRVAREAAIGEQEQR